MMATPNIVAIFLVVLSLTQYSSTKSCRNAVPGVANLTLGVDITKLDLFPLKRFSIRGFKNSIFALTCNLGKKWKSPSGLLYDVPDQVWRTMRLPRGSMKASVDILRSYHGVKNLMAEEAGIAAGYGPVAFSASLSYDAIQKRMIKARKAMIDIRSRSYSHKIILHFPQRKGVIDPVFHEYVENNLIGKRFKSNKEVFKNFIEMFGTHYLKWGEYGGVIRKYMETSSSYTNNKTDKQLSDQAHISYNMLIKSLTSVYWDMRDFALDEDFKYSTIEQKVYYGGDADRLKSDGPKVWQQTVDKDPILLTIETEPIYKLISDLSLKSQLKIAIDDYVMRSFSKEINRKVINTIGRLSYLKSKSKWSDPELQDKSSDLDLEELIRKIKKLQKVDILGRKEVLNLNSLFELYEDRLAPPKWFLEDTSVCVGYNARSKTKPKRCNGQPNKQEPTTLCATLNTYTEEFYDFPGERGNESWKEWIHSDPQGGCAMYWGIKSKNAPEWFKETQLCFSYYDMRASVQTDPIEHCAALNDFTSPYIHKPDVGYQSEHKAMRWKIVLPNKAPGWLQKSKFCLQWKSGHVYEKLCAVAGKYTPKYFDTTSYLGGGHYLKWGWHLDTDTKS